MLYNLQMNTSGNEPIDMVSQYLAEQLVGRLQQRELQPKKIVVLGNDYIVTQLQQYYTQAEIMQCDHMPSDFSAHAFDVVICNSFMSDYTALFSSAKQLLAAKGVFAFSTVGFDTLMELRDSWKKIDNKLHVNNFIDMHDLGDALRELQFVDPIVERQNLQYQFNDVFELLHAIKTSGQRLETQPSYVSKTDFQQLSECYPKLKGKCIATVEAIYGVALQSPELHVQAVGQSGEVAISIQQIKLTRNKNR